MLDQLIIGNKASVDDFDASVSARHISEAKKKEIKETVPFSNATYDFSAIDGEIYWEERELEYVFEILANSPAELEQKKTAFSGWVKNVMSENLYDPFTPDYHYVGTFSNMDYADDESMLKTTATVKFSAYPYKVANIPTVYTVSVPGSATVTVNFTNNSAHRMTPTIITDMAIIFAIDNARWSIPAGEITSDKIKLKVGTNDVEIQNLSEIDSNVIVRFYEEVF